MLQMSRLYYAYSNRPFLTQKEADVRTKYSILTILLLALAASLLPFQPAEADTGPKPSMDFEFTQDFPNPQVTITSGTMFECEQADCSDAQALQMLGPQGFRCGANSCNAVGYGFSTYHQLEIQFSDGKTRLSNIFPTAGFDSKYRVTIRPDDLLVEATTTTAVQIVSLLIFCCFLAFSLVSVVIAVLLLRRRPKK